jgi:hypothetical protein
MDEENPATTEQQPDQVTTPVVDPADGSVHDSQGEQPADGEVAEGDKPEGDDMEGDQDPEAEGQEGSAVKIDYSQDQSKKILLNLTLVALYRSFLDGSTLSRVGRVQSEQVEQREAAEVL